MKKYRFLAASTAVLIGALGVLAACSDDDTDVTPPAGEDGGADAKPDATADGNPGLDAAGDSAVDAPAFDAGLVLQKFPGQVADGFCRSYARCCFNNADTEAGAPVDGGKYNQPACLNTYGTLGFESSNVDTALIDGGNVALDQKAAADCLAKLGTLSCGAVTAVEFQTARATCFAAMQGKVAQGQPCKGSIECGTTAFCKPSADGGATGVCEPLRGLGASCGDFTNDPVRAEEACSYRVSGKPDLHCETYDFVANQFKAPADWKCVAGAPNGTGRCIYSNWCSSGLCSPSTLTCEAPLTYFDAKVCKFYVTP
jgi:hypothetical protein